MYHSLPFTQSQPNFVLLLQWPSDVSDELFSFPTAKVCTCHIDSSNWMILSLPFSLLLHLHMPQKGIIMFMWELAKPSWRDRKSTRLNSSHTVISYAVFCLKKTKYPFHPT